MIDLDDFKRQKHVEISAALRNALKQGYTYSTGRRYSLKDEDLSDMSGILEAEKQGVIRYKCYGSKGGGLCFRDHNVNLFLSIKNECYKAKFDLYQKHELLCIQIFESTTLEEINNIKW